jgi:putative intracellular protease/amidase
MRKVATFLFPEYELLDVYGPLEMFGMLSEEFELIMVANSLEPVACRAGPKTMIDHQISDGHQYDIILVPGGSGAREAVNDVALQNWLQTQASSAELITSVCTGSALLAAAGLLTGRRATTNKMAFEWATSIDPKVNWQKQARWVKDGNIYTSSGVSAG